MRNKFLKNLGATVFGLALSSASLTSLGPSNYYYRTRRGGYSGNKQYLADTGLSPFSSISFPDVKSTTGSASGGTDQDIDLDFHFEKGQKIKELLIVDGAVQNKSVFLSQARPGVDVIEIESGKSGIVQLLATLTKYHNLEAVHVVSHANSGSLQLGNDIIDAKAFEENVSALAALNGAIKSGGDLLFYGCELAKGEEGKRFLEVVQGNYDFDIAASNDLTGNDAAKADWDLEIQMGDIEATPLPESIALKDFTGVLQTRVLFDNVDNVGARNNGDASVDAIFNVGSYKLVADGAANGVAYYQNGAYEYARTSNSETSMTLDFQGGETFDIYASNASSIYIFNESGGARTFTFSNDVNGTTVTSGSIGSGAGSYIDLRSFPSGISSVTATPNSAGAWRVTYFYIDNIAPGGDTTPPEVTSIARQSPTDATTNAASATFRVTFDEDVSNVSTNGSDFAISGAGAGGTATITGASAVTGSTVFDVTVGSINTDGLLDLGFSGGQDIQDAAANAFAGTIGTEETFTIDQTGATTTTPDLDSFSDSGSETFTSGASTDNRTTDTTPTFTGSTEIGASVEVFASPGGSLGSASVDGSGNWSFTSSALTGNTSYDITAQATDALGNVGAVSSALTITLDNTAPTTTITTTSTNPTNDNPIPVTISFNEEVEDFNENEIVVTNGTTGDFFSADSVTFSVNVNPSGDGAITVNVGAGTAPDLAFNDNTAATQLSLTYDGTAPTISSSTPTDNATGVAVADDITITFNENIQFGTGFFQIRQSTDDAAIFSINASSPTATTNEASISGATLTINPGASLAAETGYYVFILSGTPILDLAGNPFSGLNNGTDLNFTTVDVTAPTLSNQALAQTDADDLEITYQSNETGTLYYIVTTNSSTPTQAQILAGNDQSGTSTNVVSSGNAAVTVTGSDQTVALNGLTLSSTTYHLFIYEADAIGNESAVVTNSSVIDATAPTLINQALAQTDVDDLEITYQSNETGTLYYIVTTNSSTPSTAQILAGNDQSGNSTNVVSSGNAAVTVTGSDQTIALNGLTLSSTTYHLFIYEEDAIGNESSVVTNSAVIDATAPTVTGVTSTTADGSFMAGDMIAITVTFSETVTVTGTPQITLETGATDRTINYTSGTGSTTLTFDYTVQAGDVSADLDYVATNSLALNSGTINDAAGNAATLTLATPGAAGSLGANKDLVIDTAAPTGYSVGILQTPINSGNETSVSFAFSSAEVGATYNYTLSSTGGGPNVTGSGTIATATDLISGIDVSGLGDGTITLSVTLTDAAGNTGTAATDTETKDTVAPSGYTISIDQSPINSGNAGSVSFTFAGAEIGADYSYAITTSGGAATLTSGGTITTATDQVTIPGGLSGFQDGTITVSVTLEDTNGNTGIAATDTETKDTVAPTVILVTSTTADGSFMAGDMIAVTVTFSETMTVTGTPQITLETGATDRTVDYTSGTGTSTLTFDYTVQAGDVSTDLDYVATNSLALNLGTINDGVGNAATLTLATPGAAGSLGANKDLVIDTTAPTVTSVSSSTTDGSFKVGDMIAVTVTFSETVNVTGTPQITLETGTTDQVVDYSSGTGSTTLTFDYTVQAGDVSADLDYVATNSLALNSGTINDGAGNAATLTLATPGAAGSLGANKDLLIDTAAPTVTSVSSSTADGSFMAGDMIAVTVTFSETVNVTGTPQITLETGTTDRMVDYSSGTGSTTLTFDYTVQAGDVSADLDYVATNSLALNSGTINDGAGNAATLTLATPGAAGSFGANKGLVIDTTAPTVTSVSSSTADGSFMAGDMIAVTVTFSETVTVTGTPQITLETGTTDRTVDYSSGTGSTTLTFDYTVQAGDVSTDLDYVATNSLALNSGTINDGAGNGATLTLATPGAAGSLGSNKDLVIDTTVPTTTSFTRKTPTASTTNADMVTYLATFSEDVMGVDMNDFTAIGVTGTSIAVSQVTAATYDVTVSGGDMANFNGAMALNFNSPSITDLAGNALPNTEPATDDLYTLDNTAPTITISTPIEGDNIAEASESSDVEISGTTTGTEDGQSVTVSFNDGANPAINVNATVTSNAWTIAATDISGLDDGSVTVTADVSDVAGNAATQASQSITLDQAPPTVNSTSPADDATNVDIETDITIAFNENIQFGSGNIQLIDLDDNSGDITIDASSPGSAASISGAVLTIDNPSGFLEEGVNYAVQIASTAIQDAGGNAFAGITDNTTLNFTTEAAPTISIGDATVTEGNSGTSNATFTVSLDKTSPKTITIDYATSDNTATTADSDYSAVSTTTLTFSPSETSKDVTVTVNGDTRDEDNETFFLDGTNPTNASFADNQGEGTITDDDDAPTVAFASTSDEGVESVSSADATVQLSTASSKTITVNYAVSGTATGSGTDYTLASGTVTFVADDVSEIVTIASIVDDAILETNETVILTLSSPTNATLGTNTTFTYTITNNDNAAVTIADASVSEDGTSVTLTATLDNQVQDGFSVTATSADGTANQTNGDYTSVSEVLTFAGTSSETQTFIVSVTDDAIVEADETITISLSGLTTSAAVDVSDGATVTINNDDSATVTIADASGNEDDGNITLTLTLDSQVDGGLSVDVSTTDGSATTADSDYTALSSETVTFTGTAGETQTVAFSPTVDNKVEDNENVTASMGNLSVPTVAAGNITTDDTGIITITNDDAAAVTIADVSSNEDDGNITVTLTLDNAVDGGLSVDASTADGTATTADSDYTAVTSETVNFSGTAGETQTIAVSPTADDKLEVDETITVSMDNLTVTTVASGDLTISATGTITLTNDDLATVTIADVSGNEDDGSITVTATLDNAVDGGFTVDMSTTDGTATTTDYTALTGETLTFAGTAGETQTFTVTPATDAIVEGDETVTVTMDNLAATTLPVTITDEATVTIDNDDAAAITIADAAGNEDDGAITVTLTLDSEVDGGLTVDVSTTDGSATTADSDYTALSLETVTFSGTAGETQTVSISPSVDNKVEADEIFSASMSNLTVTTVATNDISITDSGTITLTNDDAAAVTIADVSGEEDAGAITLTATLDNAVDGGFTVDVSSADGTASGTDYTALVGETLTFSGTAGETQTFTVTPTADEAVESDETVTVSMDNLAATNLSVTLTDEATVTITNDDNAPVITAAQVFEIEGVLSAGDVIGTVVATDADAGTTFSTWTIVSGNTEDAFAIGAGTGVISVNDPSVIDLITTPSYTLALTVSDGTNTSAEENITIEVGDGISPTVTLSSDVGEVTNTAPVSITATFSELVQGFTLEDISMTNATAENLATADDIVYTFDVTPDAEGSVSISIAASVATDVVGNSNEPSNTITYFYDTTSPSVTLTTTADAITSETSAQILIDFSEVVTGLELDDIQTSSGTLSNFTGSNAAYSVEVTGLSEGTATITVPIDAAIDAAGNGNSVGSVSWEVDLTGPSDFTVNILNPAINDLNEDNFRFRINGAEPRSTFNYTVSSTGGGTAITGSGELNGNGQGGVLDDIDVTGLGDGVLILSVEMIDEFGNLGGIATDEVRKNTETRSNGIAQGYSPNGDNIDDTWTIPGIEDLPNNSVTIFNRYGTKVWETTNYDNTNNAWDSQANVDNIFGSAGLPDGTYFYVIEFPGTNTDTKSGFVILKR